MIIYLTLINTYIQLHVFMYRNIICVQVPGINTMSNIHKYKYLSTKSTLVYSSI